MKLTGPILAKIAGAIVAAAVAGGAGAGAAHQSHGAELAQVIVELRAVASDVRLLKCNAGFPGDCPGQAAPPATAKR